MTTTTEYQQFWLDYYKRNPSEALEARKSKSVTDTKWRKENHNYIKSYKSYHTKHYIRDRIILRFKAYQILGGFKCSLCGYITDKRALQIDHINTIKHSSDIFKVRASVTMYRRIISNPIIANGRPTIY